MYEVFITSSKKQLPLGVYPTLSDAHQAVDFLLGSLKDPNGKFIIKVRKASSSQDEPPNNCIILERSERPEE